MTYRALTLLLSLTTAFGGALGCGKDGGGLSDTDSGADEGDGDGDGDGLTASGGLPSGIGGQASSTGGVSPSGGTTGDGDGDDGGAGASMGDGDGDAGASTGVGDGDGVDCNPGKVMCRRAQPECTKAFEYPQVVDGCWGDCVAIAECACTSNDDCPDPQNTDETVCYTGQGVCGPPIR